MPKKEFRTKDERTRTQWAEKFSSVTKGKLYTTEDDPLSPFPIHKYFGNKLLGEKIKMLEVNAGAALVENFVADTLTTYKITIGDKESSKEEQEIRNWYKQVEYDAKEEEACRSLYGSGYGVQQIFRTVEGSKNEFPFITLDSSTWYPDIPTFQWQSVTSGRIISIFQEEENTKKTWYAFVEKHEPGEVSYQLLKLDREDDLEGTVVPLSTVSRFAGMEDSVKTDLPVIPVFQANRQKASGDTFGMSLLFPIWDILQEISETQTQIRQERIKHLRAKFAAPIESLTKVEKERVDTLQNSKQLRATLATQAGLYDMNQEIFPIPTGGQMPAYIQRDLESIRIGLELIDSLKSDAAALIGCPKSVFNIEESAGNMKVDTEKRKDRRYVRKILQGQWQMASLRERITKAWWAWSHEGKEIDIKIEYESPFNLTQQELVDFAHSMNPMATLIAEEDAFHMVHADKTPEERKKMLANIQKEKQQSALSEEPNIDL